MTLHGIAPREKCYKWQFILRGIQDSHKSMTSQKATLIGNCCHRSVEHDGWVSRGVSEGLGPVGGAAAIYYSLENAACC